MDPLTLMLLLGGGALVVVSKSKAAAQAGGSPGIAPSDMIGAPKPLSAHQLHLAHKKHLAAQEAAKVRTKRDILKSRERRGMNPDGTAKTPTTPGGRTAASVGVDVATVGACAAGLYTGGATLAACAPAAKIVYGYGEDAVDAIGSWF